MNVCLHIDIKPLLARRFFKKLIIKLKYMSIITQEEAEQIKVVLEKTFETEAYITSAMDGTIKFIHANVRRNITKIDTQNLSIVARDYVLHGYGNGINVRFENK